MAEITNNIEATIIERQALHELLQLIRLMYENGEIGGKQNEEI